MYKLVSLVVAFSLLGSSVFAQDNDSRLKERLDNSWTVVTGKVVDVKRVDKLTTSISEHSPDWYYAEVKVKSVLKGMVFTSYRAETLRVYFPASRDVAWASSPKFQKGQKGIWLLRFAKDNSPLKRYDINAKTSLDPVDFQPSSQESKVKNLLRK